MRSVLRILGGVLLTASSAAAMPQAATPPAAQPQAVPAAAPAGEARLYKTGAGPMGVKTIDENWVDAARTRTLPVRIYLPVPSTTPPKPDADAPKPPPPATPAAPAKYPVVVFSPGLGASRINYAYFTRHLASHGYIVIVPSHPGSDTAAAIEWVRSHGGARSGQRLDPNEEDDAPGGWLMSSISSPDNLKERPRDISFMLDRIPSHATLGPIADMASIGVAGHSFGAYTAMAIGGMTVDLPESHGGKGSVFRDKRVRAVLPMSPEGAGSMGIVAGAWDGFAVPVLFLTGTRDYGVGGRSASWRRQGFEDVRGVDHYLVTLMDAGHTTFGNPKGRLLRGRAEHGAEHEALIDSLGVAFFDAYLRGDAKAKDFLVTFSMTKRSDCVPEFRPADAKPANGPAGK